MATALCARKAHLVAGGHLLKELDGGVVLGREARHLRQAEGAHGRLGRRARDRGRAPRRGRLQKRELVSSAHAVLLPHEAAPVSPPSKRERERALTSG